MPIISKEYWDKFTQEEKEKIRKKYQYFHKVAYHGAMESYETLFPEEALQPKPLTYEDVARELFLDKNYWIYSSANNNIQRDVSPINRPINSTSREQIEKLLAINKLLNVAAYLNKNEDGTPWKPDWSDNEEWKYTFWLRTDLEGNVEIKIDRSPHVCQNVVYFRTEELAKQAIQILGEDTVRLALGNY